VRAALAVDSRDRIGEAPLWDAKNQRLLWTDLERGIVHAAVADGIGGWCEVARWDLARPLAAAIPRTSGGLIVAGGIEILTLDVAGNLAPWVALDQDPALIRFNDAKCDPSGRLWAGTLALDFTSRAALYRIDPDRSIHRMLEGLTIANGMDWSPDARTFYFTDSLTRRVDAFDFDLARGALRRQREFITIELGAGGPNGLTVDHEGCVWLAVTGSGQVRRYSPEGTELMRIDIATPGATSCAFGGPDGTHLFIASLGRRMPDVARTLGLTEAMMTNDRAESGGVFVCQPGTRGRAATPFAG
jgi:sugar lactone lactonase YvrE